MGVSGGRAAPRGFPSTRWTLILASRSDPEARRAALEDLAASYWRPLYALARMRGCEPDAAEDAVQSFLARLLERDFLASLDPERGRFRAWLRTAFTRHLMNLHAHASAARRGGGVAPLPYDEAERALAPAMASPAASADRIYDREWALGVMERALARLRDEYQSGARSGPFELVQDHFGGEEPPAYAESAARHGMSVPKLKSFLHRARGRFRELVREEVAETVPEGGEVDAELRELLEALAT